MTVALLLVFLQAATPPAQLPPVDVTVEVVGHLPLQQKLQDVTRLLEHRRRAEFSHRTHLPTILELIMLVERNPARPRGRMWDSIGALNLRYNAAAQTVTVDYCIDNCDVSPAGAVNPRRQMVSYTAPEKDVEKKADKKIKDLQKYADR